MRENCTSGGNGGSALATGPFYPLNSGGQLRQQYESIKEEFLQNSHITSASAAHNISGARPYVVFPEGAERDSIRMRE